MKTFKEHILEKLKVTKFSGTGITYQEYYDLLDKYCNTVPEKFLDLGVINNFDDDLQKYRKERYHPLGWCMNFLCIVLK